MITNIVVLNEDVPYVETWCGEILCEAYYDIENRTSGLFDQIDLIIRNYKNIRSMGISKERKAFKLLEATRAGTIVFEKYRYLQDNRGRKTAIKEKDIQNEFINMTDGYIMLNREMAIDQSFIPNMVTIEICYNSRLISYDSMLEFLNKCIYDNKYKNSYKIDIESFPKFDINPRVIPFDKWDEFKQIILSNKFMKFKNDFGGYYSYAHLN